MGKAKGKGEGEEGKEKGRKRKENKSTNLLMEEKYERKGNEKKWTRGPM